MQKSIILQSAVMAYNYMIVLPPGNILQNLYVRERLKKLKPKSFCEIGSGNGHISRIFLEKNIPGIAYDLNTSACRNNTALNKKYINTGMYQVINDNFFQHIGKKTFDLIISCMVIEHFAPEAVDQYFSVCKNALNVGGSIVILVPAGMKYWGVEDQIAGHFKRYSFHDFQQIAKTHNLRIVNMSGLTFPVSNILLRLSNKLVSANENYKRDLSRQEQTLLSGNRDVKFKTSFPRYLKILLNEVTMYPFHLLQKMNKRNSNSMVIYCEMTAG
jgi:SAM-dependent methyltransferase